MRTFSILLLFSVGPYLPIEAQTGYPPSSPCCQEKRVGNVDYTLVTELSSGYYPNHCMSGCTYRETGQTDGHQFCFARGDLSVACLEESAMRQLDYEAVKEDLVNVMTDSQEFWPADYGHYGPLMIRLAWHSSGSYRASDGRGGSDGGRLRFDPERSWDDNVHLEKARRVLRPIKMKYGPALSWGDLMVMAGNTAIESMGGVILGFCGGRIDDYDGSDSTLLGPNVEQSEGLPCETQGLCQAPLGTSTVGLIYVNPEGPMAVPNPQLSSMDIRDVFSRMNMNDSESIALIGGGHAFGKTHGPCPDGPGLSPAKDPLNSWPGKCGTGKLQDAFTSGFEFAFTSKPTQWDNEYFKNLLNFEWIVHTGPGGKNQWKVTADNPPQAPSSDLTGTQPVGALTSDIALLNDQVYTALTRKFADDQGALDHAFKHAWYKLTTRDMGPHSRCIGPLVPPPQDWQYPLPSPPAQLADFTLVKLEIEKLLDGGQVTIGMLTRLAWRCSATYRATDYLGGCNGARIRLSPQKDWPVNRDLDQVLLALSPVKIQFPGLSSADLIILAANTALQRSGGVSPPFCGGRTDAEIDGGASEFLQPRLTGNLSDSLFTLKDTARMMGLSQREFAVLNAAGYAIGDYYSIYFCVGLFCRRDPPPAVPTLDNIFFNRLLNETWEEFTESLSGRQLYKAVGKPHLMLKTDLYYLVDDELRTITEEYARNNDKFLTDVTQAWTKLANADRFDGPKGNLCYGPRGDPRAGVQYG